MATQQLGLDFNRKTKATLINATLRIFPQRESYVATRFYPSYTYMYDHNAAALTLSMFSDTKGIIASNVWTKDMFDDIIKYSKYKYKWDAQKMEDDHAMDLQHIIRMTFGTGSPGERIWDSAPFGAYLYLGFFLNDKRNTWKLPAALNKVKGQISYVNWVPHRTEYKVNKQEFIELANAEQRFIEQYLFGFSDDAGHTPFSELLSLATEMAGLPPSDLTQLTIMAGQKMAQNLSEWADRVKLNSFVTNMAKAKDSKIGIQDMLGNMNETVLHKRKILEERAKERLAMLVSDYDTYGASTKKLKTERQEDLETEDANLYRTSNDDEETYDNW